MFVTVRLHVPAHDACRKVGRGREELFVDQDELGLAKLSSVQLVCVATSASNNGAAICW